MVLVVSPNLSWAQSGDTDLHPDVTSGFVDVPAASIYYEKRGAGPMLLLIPDGPFDAGIFLTLAERLSACFTVVAIDPRCNSRSSCREFTAAFDVNSEADDAADVITELTGGQAFVFGTRGGAHVALSLAANHPYAVRSVIAHESPSMALLEDPSEILAANEAMYEAGRNDGIDIAIERFLAERGLSGLDDSVTPGGPALSPEYEATLRRVRTNFDYWLIHGMNPVFQFQPNISALRDGNVAVHITVGKMSLGRPTHEMGVALSTALSTELIVMEGSPFVTGPDVDDFADGVLEAFTGQTDQALVSCPIGLQAGSPAGLGTEGFSADRSLISAFARTSRLWRQPDRRLSWR